MIDENYYSSIINNQEYCKFVISFSKLMLDAISDYEKILNNKKVDRSKSGVAFGLSQILENSKWDEYLIETRAIHTKDTLEKLKGLYSTNINDIDVGDVTKVFSEIRQIILFQKSRFSKVDFKEYETEMEFYNGFIWDKLSNVALKMKEKKDILKSDFEVCKKYIEELEKVSKKETRYLIKDSDGNLVCDIKRLDGNASYYKCLSTDERSNIQYSDKFSLNDAEHFLKCRDEKELKEVDELLEEIFDDYKLSTRIINFFKTILRYIALPFIFIYKTIAKLIFRIPFKKLFKKKDKKKEKKPKVKKEKVIKEKVQKEKIKKVRKEKISKPRKKFNFKIKLPKIKLDIGNLKDLFILVIPLVMILLVPSGVFLKIIEIIIEVGNAIMTKCYSEFFITKLIFSMPGFEGFLVIFSFLLKLVFGVAFAIVEFVLMVVSFILLFVLGLGLNILALIIQFAIPILIVLYIVLMIIRMVKKGYKWSDIIVSLLVLGLLVFLCFVFFILYKESVLANK